MSKELVISASPHETRVAVLEDGQLCEIYVEREKEFALVGSIYKGRVTRVLPGMQSAFVDIGLDSDAFLYVSDFLEESEEYESIVSTVEEKVHRMEQQGGQVFAPASEGRESAAEPPEVVASTEPAPPGAPEGTTAIEGKETPPAKALPPRFKQRPGGGRGYGRGRDRRGRWGPRHGPDRRGHDLPPSKYAPPRHFEPPAELEPVILPGESLAKYKDRIPLVAPASAPEQPAEAIAPPAAEPVSLEAEVSAPTEAPEVLPEAATAEAPIAAPEVSEAAPTAAESAAPAPQPKATTLEPIAIPEETTEAREVPEVKEEPSAAPVAAEESLEAPAIVPEEDWLEPLAQPEEAAEWAAEFEERIESVAAMAEAAEEFAEEETEAEVAEAAALEMQAEEPPPTTARVQNDTRAHLQRPVRRGGRRRAMRRGRPHIRPQPIRRPQLISELLKPGQEVIVQIAKEPLGKKGARITSHVALPGRFLVYMPTVDHVGVSRKIALAEQRARLRRLVSEVRGTYPGGFIVRTAAESATDEEIRSDVEFLGRTWGEIRTRAEQRRAPALLHRDLDLIERILRDYLSADYSAIWIDSEEDFTRVVEFVSRFQPQLVNRVKLYVKESPIFEEFGIQQEVEKALRPKVWLKSGGYIVINHTEALVAIDVNTGKFVGKGSTRLEDTIVKTNLEAVKEIVRQIRLRDLGGIIVVDFIDMEERKNRLKVMQALEEALRSDRAPSKVLSFNEFGLVAITRKRTKQALERVLCQPCPYCTGSGMVKSIPTICYEIQAEARKMAPEIDSQSVTLRVHPEIAKALKTRESALIDELEHWTHKSIVIQADPTLHWEQYDIY